MAEKEERPYFDSSISQLETLFERLKTNPDSLKVLDYELKLRTTNRAVKLRSRIADAVAAVSFKPVNAAGTDGASRSTVPPPMDLGESSSDAIPQKQTSQRPSLRKGSR